MGVVKRIIGWRRSGWPIPNTLQMLVGLIPYRDPEAFAERKTAAREAAAERRALQEERPLVIPPAAPIIPKSAVPIPDLAAADPDLGDVLPARAAAGWYRYGRTFYPIRAGPCPDWGFEVRDEPPATRQLMLF